MNELENTFFKKYTKTNLNQEEIKQSAKDEEFLLKPIYITEEEFERLEKESKPTEALKRLMSEN